MKHKIIKINLLFLILFCSSTLLIGQEQTAVDLNFWPKILGNMVMIAGGLVIAVAFLSIVRLFNVIMKMEELRMLKEKGIEEVVEHYKQPEKPFLKRLWEKMEAAVPVSQEQDILFDHEYDGIRELDNKLPPWWVGMFYITIVIAVGYWYVYHMSDIGLSSAEKYELEMEEAEESVKAYLAKQADAVDEENVELLTDELALGQGEGIFKNLCATCHGQYGEGGIGPNFADNYWIHGGDIKDLFKIIKYGVPEKGMISWTSQLRPSDMQKVASYILTLPGTDPPNQKEPQGELYQAEKVTTDTTSMVGMK